MIDKDTKKIMEDLSKTLYGSKHRYRKLLDNGLEERNSKIPPKEVMSRYGKRFLHEYKQRYFANVNDLMQFMVDKINNKLAKPSSENK